MLNKILKHNLPLRMKRLRQTSAIRSMMQENHLHIEKIIAPLFIHESITEKKPIANMPGHFQLTLHDLASEINELSNLGIKAVLLFGIPAYKDPHGSNSLHPNGIIQQAIRKVREINTDLTIITDVCFCEYTNHGHCGILQGMQIDNDRTLELLTRQAITHAEAGANWVAPSGMVDGMVAAIRHGLDKAGYINTAILSYAIKYHSNFYGPFREAAEGKPQFNDRQDYQMNPANASEAYREAALDLAEGADILMVKPAQLYLDIIFRIKQRYPEIPLCAYQVSAEYALLKMGVRHNIISAEQSMVESLLAIKRAGADLIITYFAKDLARLLQQV